MIKLPVNLKKAWLTAVIILFAVFFTTLHAQKLDFTIKTDSTIINGSKEYTITIKITSGKGPYSYYLCDKVPWVGGVVLQQYLDIQSSKYVFTRLTQFDNYVVFVKGSRKDEYIWKSVSARNEKK